MRWLPTGFDRLIERRPGRRARVLLRRRRPRVRWPDEAPIEMSQRDPGVPPLSAFAGEPPFELGREGGERLRRLAERDLSDLRPEAVAELRRHRL